MYYELQSLVNKCRLENFLTFNDIHFNSSWNLEANQLLIHEICHKFHIFETPHARKIVINLSISKAEPDFVKCHIPFTKADSQGGQLNYLPSVILLRTWLKIRFHWNSSFGSNHFAFLHNPPWTISDFHFCSFGAFRSWPYCRLFSRRTCFSWNFSTMQHLVLRLCQLNDLPQFRSLLCFIFSNPSEMCSQVIQIAAEIYIPHPMKKFRLPHQNLLVSKECNKNFAQFSFPSFSSQKRNCINIQRWRRTLR